MENETNTGNIRELYYNWKNNQVLGKLYNNLQEITPNPLPLISKTDTRLPKEQLENTKCQKCNSAEEITQHIISSCKQLAPKSKQA